MFKMGLRKKILLSYAILIIFLIVISSMASQQLSHLKQINEQIIKNHYESIFAFQNMLKILQQFQQILFLASSEKLEQREDADKLFEESQKEFSSALEDAKIYASLDGEEEIINKIEGFYLGYLDKYELMRKHSGRDKRKTSLYQATARLQLDYLRQQCLTLLDRKRKALISTNDKLQKVSSDYYLKTIEFSVFSIILGIILAIWQTQMIVGPMEELTTAVAEIRKGNLDIIVRETLPDEIGILASEFNKMTTTLRDYKKINLEKLLEEKKRTEAIIRSVGDCMIVIDTNFRIITVNPTAERVFYLLPGISNGRDLRDMIKSEEFFKIIKLSIEEEPNPEEYRSLPTFAWDYDREKKYFQVKVYPVTREEGAKIGYVILLEDVTKLKEVDQLKSEFISVASHELRTPLTSIVMSLGMVLDGSAGDLSEDQKELLGAANEESIRMRELMTNLLDISRIESGKVKMELDEVDPEVLINSIANSFNLRAESQGIKMEVDVPKDIKPINADYARLIQVFNNLIGNALRYTPEGGSITITALNKDDFVHFIVADTGAGIPRDSIHKIFEKFVQIETDKRKGGAGLGLAVSAEIIKAHGGKIWAESEINKGSKFHFLLPIAKEGQG